MTQLDNPGGWTQLIEMCSVGGFVDQQQLSFWTSPTNERTSVLLAHQKTAQPPWSSAAVFLAPPSSLSSAVPAPLTSSGSGGSNWNRSADQMRRARPCSAAGLGGLIGLDAEAMVVPPRNSFPASQVSEQQLFSL
jgi:hypothetical protein